MINESTTDPSLVAFYSWLDTSGPWPEPGHCKVIISPETLNSGRGLVAQTRLTKGDCFLAFPTNDIRLVLTPVRCAHLLSLCGCFAKFLPRCITPFDCLVLFMYHIKSSPRCLLATIWCPYLALLPRSYTDPVFLLKSYPDLISKLHSSDVRRVLSGVFTRYEETWSRLRVIINTRDAAVELAPSNFVWAWSTVNSRCVHTSLGKEANKEHDIRLQCRDLLQLPMSDLLHQAWFTVDDKDDSTIALIVLFDFLNHNPAVSLTPLSQPHPVDGGLRLNAGSDFEEGDEIFICYGYHDNLALFAEYGFLIPSANPNDAVYPSSTDILSLYHQNSAPTFLTLLNSILVQMSITPVDSSNQMWWPSVFLSPSGPSYHLSVLLFGLGLLSTNTSHSLSLEDLYSVDEERLQTENRTVVSRLICQLKELSQMDFAASIKEVTLPDLFRSEFSKLLQCRLELLQSVAVD